MKLLVSILLLIGLQACNSEIKQEKPNSSSEIDYFQKYFNNLPKTNESKDAITLYEDSISAIRNKILQKSQLLHDKQAKKLFIEALQKDSLLLKEMSIHESSLLYHSYNGFSEGANSVKNVYSQELHKAILHEKLQFLKAIEYNLQQNTSVFIHK